MPLLEQLKDPRSAEPAGCQDPTVQQLAEWRVPRGDVAAYLDRQRPADREQTKLGNRWAEADLRSWSKHVPPSGKKSGA